MAYHVFLTVLLISFFSCYYQSKIWTDFRFVDQLTKLNSSNLSEYCKSPGLQCADCQTSILCRVMEGNYTAMVYQKCADPYTCDEGACTVYPNGQCTKQQYECQTVEGMYPDPSSCNKFHYCVPNAGVLQHFESKCDEDYYYNPLTTYCDKKLLSNKTCPVTYVPKCVKSAQSGPLKENPSIYYTCLPINANELYPFLDACKHGKKYDGNTYSCK